MSGKIFVVGASGYTGSNLVELAVARGMRVTAHLRPDSPSRTRLEPGWRRAGVTVALGPLHEEVFAALLGEARPTQVFALLGTTRARERASGGFDTYARVDRGFTMSLLQACAREAPSARFVYLSAAGVSPGARRGYYGARAKVEAALVASEQPYTILRPSFISGPDRVERRPAERIASRTAASVLGLARVLGAEGLADRWAPLCGREVALALLEAGLEPSLEGKVLEGSALRRVLARARPEVSSRA